MVIDDHRVKVQQQIQGIQQQQHDSETRKWKRKGEKEEGCRRHQWRVTIMPPPISPEKCSAVSGSNSSRERDKESAFPRKKKKKTTTTFMLSETPEIRK